VNKKFNYLTKNNLIWSNLCKEHFWAMSNTIPLPNNFKKCYVFNKFCNRFQSNINSVAIGEIIYIYGHRLDQLPKEIEVLTNLQQLFLNKNGLYRLPEEIGLCRSLKILDLAFNNFFSLPSTIGQLVMLEKLNLHSNELCKLPFTIGNLTNLKILELSKNKLLIYLKHLVN
jgi:Leucine-rich repeat (LRR) protein